MSTASNVLTFPNRSTLVPDTTLRSRAESKPTFRVSIGDRLVEAQSARMLIDDLYPATESVTPELGAALRLLAKGIQYTDDAFETIQNKNVVASDDAMQRLQALLPELFNCRSLGDGYGAIINAILCSLENMHGAPLSQQQIQAIKQVLEKVRSEPFMKFGDAVEEVMKLEQAGLVVEPEGLEYLADYLDE